MEAVQICFTFPARFASCLVSRHHGGVDLPCSRYLIEMDDTLPIFVIKVWCLTNPGLVPISPTSTSMYYLSEVAEGSGTTAGVGLATTKAACEACILLTRRGPTGR